MVRTVGAPTIITQRSSQTTVTDLRRRAKKRVTRQLLGTGECVTVVSVRRLARQ